MDKKTIKSLIYKAASLLLLAIFLCTSVFIYLQKSFGWFSDNTEVSASGLSVRSSEGLDVEATFKDPTSAPGTAVKPNITTGKQVSFLNLHPGNIMYVNLELKNNEAVPVNVTLSLKAPTEDDDVVVTTNNVKFPDNTVGTGYTYFGAHIRINSIKLDGTDKMLSSLTGTMRYLLDYDTTDEDETHNTFFSKAYPFETNTADKQLTDTIELAKAGETGSTVTLVLEIEFVDNEMVQNPLIDFGAVEGQVCTRMLICTTEEVNP